MFDISKSSILKKLNPKAKKGYKSWFWLLLIVLFALALRLWFFVVVGLNDDFVYTDLSSNVAEGKFSLYLHPFIRPMMLLPIGFFYFLFGISHYSSILYILLTAIGILLVTFYIGKILFNKSVGLVAAFIASFVPIFTIFSTEVVPDIPLAFFWGLSVLLFLVGERSRKQSNIYYFFSGCSIAFAYLTKSLGIIGLLFFLFYFLYKRQLKRVYLFVLLGFVFIFSIEGVYYYLNTGDFLASFKTNSDFFTNPDFRSPGQFPDQLFYLNMFRSLGSSSRFGLLFVLFAISAAYGLYKRDRPLILLLIWFMSLYLFLEFGSMSYQKFVPIHKIDRFSIVLLIPMSIAVSSLLLKINRKLTSIILAALFVASVAHISNLYMEQRPEVMTRI